jgi:adenylate kinase
MVGAPGAGKGTQATILGERLGLPIVASGELLRDAVRSVTPLGRKAEGYMERGALVPDDLVLRLIGERLRQPDAAEGAILDGFPRTRMQAEALDEFLRRRGAAVEAALYIDVPRDALFRRLSGRWLCRAEGHPYHEVDRPPKKPGVCDIDGSELYQRPDDEPETVRQRLQRQLPPMYEVADYYSQRGLLSTIKGDAPIDEVADSLLRAIAQPVREPARAPAPKR